MSESEDLSFNDMVMPKYNTQVLWVFDYIIDDLEKPLIEFLRCHCPTAFYQIVYDIEKKNRGKLVKLCADDNRIYSREEKLDMSVADYINYDLEKLDVFPYPSIPTDTSPLFFLHQITVRDGTLLAVGKHHHFCDGHAFFLLIHRFCNWLHNKDDLKMNSFIHDRSLLKPASCVRYDHPEYTTAPRILDLSKLPLTEVVTRNYTKQQLFDKLEITAKNVTFNDVLVAWLTKTISQIRQLPQDITVTVYMAYNGRNEWNIGPDYFNNCNFFICMPILMADLNKNSVNELAQWIGVNKKKFMSREYMESGLAYIQSASETVRANLNIFSGQDLGFSNWSHFPIYKLDFGHGRPKRFTIAPNHSDGFTMILPSLTGDGVELYISLRKDHADQLRKQFDAL